MRTNPALAAALLLGGCAILHPEEKLPPAAQAPGVELTKEQGGRFIALVGPRQLHSQPFLDTTGTNYFALRSWLDTKTGEIAHQLYVEASYYGGPYKWDGAHDAANTKLRFISIARNEITCDLGCAYFDQFAAALPDDYLRAHRDGGMTVTFTSANGKTLPMTVSPALVGVEIDALDAVRGAVQKAAASPPAKP